MLLNQLRVWLASASPRRRELLEQMAITYQVIVPQVDETNHKKEPPETYTCNLAISKAKYVQDHINKNNLDYLPIVAADTAVVLDDTIFGKPNSIEQSRQMLSALSGRTHQVYSSVVVYYSGVSQSATQISKVSFRSLSQSEIDAYWKTGEPIDKAGSYAVQGLGAQFITHLSGSYSGVMGLPLYELMQMLATIKP